MTPQDSDGLYESQDAPGAGAGAQAPRFAYPLSEHDRNALLARFEQEQHSRKDLLLVGDTQATMTVRQHLPQVGAPAYASVRHDAAPWEPMYGEAGELLEGIRGKSGASGVGSDGYEIGGDLIEMQPGSRFPLHIHPGDHILYAVSGEGTVTVDGQVHHFPEHSSFYIAAQYPHAVGTYREAREPFVLFAVGHPQKHVSDKERMTVLEHTEKPVTLHVHTRGEHGLTITASQQAPEVGYQELT